MKTDLLYYIACVLSCSWLVHCSHISTPHVSCSESANKRICNFTEGLSPDRIVLDEDIIFVGSTDHIFSFDIAHGLQLRESLNFAPNESRKQDCMESSPNNVVLCRNYVRVVQPVNSGISGESTSLFVCSSNAEFPKCSLHRSKNLSDWSYTSPVDKSDDGFSPHDNRHNVWLMPNNNTFYTGTFFDPSRSFGSIAVAENPLQANATFIATTQSTNPNWFSHTNTRFVSMYDTDEHVYVFASEPAQEIDNGRSLVVSRVIRVCKSDRGIMNDQNSGIPSSAHRWSTYQKITLKCTAKFNNMISPAFVYNELQSTYIHHPNMPGSGPVVYAAFSSPTNGPSGGAICTFTLDSLKNAFNSRKYIVSRNLVWETEDLAPSFSCGESNPRKPLDAVTYLQLADPVSASAIATQEGGIYTAIAVDTYQYNGSSYVVVFVAISNGQLQVIVKVDGTLINMYTLYSSQGKLATKIILNKSLPNETRRLYVAAEGFLSELTLGNCSSYLSCTECLESNDPYCVWLENTSECHNKLTSPVTIIGSIETTRRTDIRGVCGVPTAPTYPSTDTRPPTTPTVPSSVTHIYSTTSLLGPIFTNLPPTDDINTLDGSEISVGGTVGIAIGGVLVGLVLGVAICLVLLYLKRNLHAAETSTEVTVTRYQSSANNGEPQQTVEISNGYGIPSPPLSDVSQLEDDVISDLPTNTNSKSKIKRWPVPRGRTPSTRWLRASESSTNGDSSSEH